MTKFNPDRFEVWQFEASDTAVRRGIQNRSSRAEQANGLALWENCLVPIYNLFNRVPSKQDVIINSWFRNATINDLVGGATTSQHTTGQAADIWFPGWKARDAFENIYENRNIFKSGFDQLILEHPSATGGWVHISYRRPEAGKNRMMVLIIDKKGVRNYV